jgi:pimeloyl-ACP methyl ester carboxylesterase/cell wall-associated NlpC family hydrolase
MSFIEINGAQIYYDTYGKEQPDQAPIVLIHGSTNTGRADWEWAAPLLARQYYVIVPDCRGHGQSSNPNHSYSFREMADDVAALVRALGYERAHIIGHSNGGNVALVTLLEHPEVVQTCIPQAANAYVSADLVAREPRLFDPERVARESPGWMNEMIALHGLTHGPEYWRELLALTLHETITEPNYTANDLAKVQRPTLVIQGEKDTVNAPGRHAQFIAYNIPNAELWLPAGVKHNVHHERLFGWVEHVLDFLARRGDEVNDAIYRLKRQRYADERETVFDVKMTFSPAAEPGKAPKVQFSGKVLTSEQFDAALGCLPEAWRAQAAEDADVNVLLSDSSPWGLINRSVTDLRHGPHPHAERTSQALLGEAVRVLDTSDDWAFVRTEKDNYLGWMNADALKVCTRNEVVAYQEACNTLVLAETATAYFDITQLNTIRTIAGDGNWNEEVGKLPFGVAVPVAQRRNMRSAIRLPDGSIWWLFDSDLLPLRDRPQPDADGIARTLALIRRFVGIPYMWGGRTPFGYDCSGLAQTFYAFMGIAIPRDADQQFRAGAPVEGDPQPGDLLFFGENREDARRPITHVAISLGGQEMIHANGSAWGISYNSLDEEHPLYREWLRHNLVGVRRYR